MATDRLEMTWGATFDQAVGLAVELGLRPEAFFNTTGEKPRQSRGTGSRIPLDLLARFLAWAAETSGDHAFGLKLGARVHPSDLGAYGYLLLNSPTLGAAMTLAHRFADFQQQGDALVWKAMPDGHIEVRYDAVGLEERLRRQDAECTLAIVHAVLHRLAGRVVRPVEVRVQHASQSWTTPLESHFGCPVAYGDRDNALRYDASLLSQPIRGADPKLLAILTQYVEQELEGLPPPGDELGRVRWAIRRSLGTPRMTLEGVARQCRLGERTLQRRLARHGLAFSDLVDLVRQDVHAELDRSGCRNLNETAERLGFYDASALAKARRRWTRTGP
ncbi:MAG: AraC family transcriptional regulator ligand-binding domain-containing protein [Caulobacter sp.]